VAAQSAASAEPAETKTVDVGIHERGFEAKRYIRIKAEERERESSQGIDG
jgi:hypothetical protein